MSGVWLLVATPFLLFGAMIAMQVWMVRRMSALEGTEAPALSGDKAAAVASQAPALFYFYSAHCGACRPMGPIIDALAARCGQVHKIDIARDMDTARRFSVMATPTVVVTRGGRIDTVLVGPQRAEVLAPLICPSAA